MDTTLDRTLRRDGGDGCDARCRREVGPALAQFQRRFGLDGGGALSLESALAVADGWVVAGHAPRGERQSDAVVARVAPDGQIRWARAYGGDGDDLFYDPVALPGGDFIAVGVTDSFGAGEEDTYTVRLGPTGELRWSRVLGSPGADHFYGVARTASGAFMATGDTEAQAGDYRADILAVAFADDGAITWQRAIGSDRLKWDIGRDVLVLPDDEVFIVATTDSWKPSIEDDLLAVRLSAEGFVRMAKTHSYFDVRLGRASLTPNGEVLVAGAQRGYADDDWRMFFARMGTDGESVFRAGYTDGFSVFNHAVEDARGETIVVGRDVDLIWDRWSREPARTSVQARRVGEVGGNWETTAVVPTGDGDFFIAGRDNAGHAWLLRGDAEDQAGGCNARPAGARPVHVADPRVDARMLRDDVLELPAVATRDAGRPLSIIETLDCSVE